MRRSPPTALLIAVLCLSLCLLALLVGHHLAERESIEPSHLKKRTSPPTSTPHSFSASGERSASMFSASVVVAGQSWKLIASSQLKNKEFAEFVSTDIQSAFAHLPDYVVDKLPSVLSHAEMEFDRRVRFEGGTRFFPSAFEAEAFACVRLGQSVSELFIPESVVRAYQEAWELRSRKGDAFGSIDDFIDRLNKIQDLPIDAIESLFVGSNESLRAQLRSMDFKKLRDAWSHKKYVLQSQLDITETSKTEFELYGSVLARIYLIESNRLKKMPPLIYTGPGTGWQFLLIAPLT